MPGFVYNAYILKEGAFKTEIRLEFYYLDKCCYIDLGWFSMAGKAWRSAVCTGVYVKRITNACYCISIIQKLMVCSLPVFTTVGACKVSTQLSG